MCLTFAVLSKIMKILSSLSLIEALVLFLIGLMLNIMFLKIDKNRMNSFVYYTFFIIKFFTIFYGTLALLSHFIKID